MLCLGLLAELEIYNGSTLVARQRDADKVRPTLSRAEPSAARCLHPYGPAGVMHPGENSPRMCCAPTAQPSPGVFLTPFLTQGVLHVKSYIWHRLTCATAAAPTLCGCCDMCRAALPLTKWQLQVSQSPRRMRVNSWVPNTAARGTAEPPVLMNPVILLHLCSWHAVRNTVCQGYEKSLNNQLPRTDNWCLSAASLQNPSLLIKYTSEVSLPKQGSCSAATQSPCDVWEVSLQVFKSHYEKYCTVHAYMYMLQKVVLAIHIQLDYPD